MTLLPVVVVMKRIISLRDSTCEITGYISNSVESEQQNDFGSELTKQSQHGKVLFRQKKE